MENRNQKEANLRNRERWKKFHLFVESIKLTWLQFTRRSSIQGVRFITDEKGTLFTKYV